MRPEKAGDGYYNKKIAVDIRKQGKVTLVSEKGFLQLVLLLF